MKICYFGSFEKDYPRNNTFINGLRKTGVQVSICHVDAKKEGKEAFVSIKDFIKFFFSFFLGYFKAFLCLLKEKYLSAIIIGYPGHLDVIAFYPLLKLKKVPILFNPLVTLYDTFVEDRKIFKPKSIFAKILKIFDTLSFNLPHIVFMDTEAHKSYVCHMYGVNPKKVKVIPVGAEDVYFKDVEEIEKAKTFQVLFFGKYIPLHGIETIIDAAEILMNQNIKFELVGKGQEFKKIFNMVEKKQLKNITFIDWLSPEELVHEIHASHIVLGIFCGKGKALRVVPNKVYDALAAGSVTITAKTPAILEFFKEDEEIFLVEPENPQALAEKILWVRENYEMAKKVALNGKKKVKEIASEESLGNLIKRYILSEK